MIYISSSENYEVKTQDNEILDDEVKENIDDIEAQNNFPLHNSAWLGEHAGRNRYPTNFLSDNAIAIFYWSTQGSSNI